MQFRWFWLCLGGVMLLATDGLARRAPRPRPLAAIPASSVTVYKVTVGSSPSQGPGNALVTLVMFGDFQCQFTRKSIKTIRQLRRAYKKELRWVFKHNPLPFHKNGVLAAQAAVEAHKQKKFWTFFKLAMKGKRTFTRADVLKWGKRAGLKRGSVARALASGTHQSAVKSDKTAAARVGARGTPAFYINGTKIAGAKSLAVFKKAVQRELARARKALKAPGVTRKNLYARLVAKGKILPVPRPIRPRVTRILGLRGRSGGLRGLFGRRRRGSYHRTSGTVGRKNWRHVSLVGAPSTGSNNALVTMVIFTHFRCSYGNYIWDAYQDIKRQYPGMIKVFFKHHGIYKTDRLAWLAAQATMAAQAQGKFWEFADILFRNRYSINKQNLESYAQEVGLNMKAYRAALRRRSYRKRADREVVDMYKLHKTRTCPILWVNDKVHRGYIYTYRIKSLLRTAINEVQNIRIRPLL